MTLKAKIDAYKENFKTRVPKETREIMSRATENLRNSARMLRTVKVGDIAPDFSLKNFSGAEIALGDLLDRGPVVLVFYRGRW